MEVTTLPQVCASFSFDALVAGHERHATLLQFEIAVLAIRALAGTASRTPRAYSAQAMTTTGPGVREDGDALARPRLHETLTAGPGREMTMVIAPAGYGKTVLMESWAATLDLPVAWVALTEEHPAFWRARSLRQWKHSMNPSSTPSMDPR